MRLGPYGDAFGARPDGLTLERLKDAPHGIDLGPLQPRLPEVLRTPAGKVELAPEPLIADAARLARLARRTDADGFVLIGRRHLRSNNSWMHNVPALAGGTNRCTLQIHPDDAAELGLDGHRDDQGTRRRTCGPVEPTPTPCGAAWCRYRTAGVTTAAARGSGVAAGQPGVNVNQLNDGTAARSAVGHGGAQRHPRRNRSRAD